VRNGSCHITGMHPVDRVSHQIIGAAINVHKQRGPGLLESVYLACLGQELVEMDMNVHIGMPLSLDHKGLHIHRAYVVDLLVEDCVIVEVKCVQKITDLHVAQLLTYLRLTGIRVGLIINFNVIKLKHGIRRVVNRHVDEDGNPLPFRGAESDSPHDIPILEDAPADVDPADDETD
jgi:GxxExxY protein